MIQVGPWDGLRVIDASTGVAGAYAARVALGLGADVVKLEHPDLRDPLRERGTVAASVSSGFTAFNAGKRSVVLDEDDPRVDDLLASADVLIESGGFERFRGQDLSVRHPHLVHVSIEPFGGGGPRADWTADDLVLGALAGWMAVQGERGHEPTSTGTDTLSVLVGNAALVEIAAALTARERDGRGQQVRARALEVAVATQIFDVVAVSYLDIERERRANEPTEPWGVLATRDGHVAVAGSALRAWDELWVPVFGEDVPEWVLAADPVADGAALRAALEPLIAGRDKRELVELCQLLGHIVGEVLTIAEVLESPQHAARDYFDRVGDGAAALLVPGPPARMPGTPWQLGGETLRPVPARGADTAEVLAHWSEPRVLEVRDPDLRPPLDGLRVVDFTMGWAGPYATELLADLGAEVVKIESIGRTDWWRTARRMFTGPVPDPDWLWEISPLWNAVNESKRSVTLDMNDPSCRALAHDLVASADIVIENFTPRVMTAFGLDFASVHALNPRAVMVSMPGFGSDGPWGQFRSTALVTEAMSGLTGRTGRPDGMPQILQMSPADPNAGLVAAWAGITALGAARRSGVGQHVEVAQVEAMTHHLAAELVEVQVGGAEPARRGNTSPDAALSGCWQAADGRWVVVSVARDRRDRLAAVIGDTESDGEAALAAWIAASVAEDAVTRLQTAGVSAGVVQSAREVLADPHLRATGFFHTTTRVHVGEHDYPSSPLRFQRTPVRPRTPAPTLGQHTEEVLRAWLSVPEDTLATLAADGLIGTEPRGTHNGKVA